MKRLLLLAPAFGLMLSLAAPAQAQLNGSHTLGDFGVQSGSQPAPGVYAALFYLHYDTDTIKDADGKTVGLAPGDPGSLGVSAIAPMLWYVSKTKFMGANVGAMAVVPWANASLEAPAFALGKTVDTSVSDMLVRPLDLGWHKPRADVAAGFQLYAPTGRYERGGSDNIGKGMWTYEPFVGTTVYFDKKRIRQFRHHRLLGIPRRQEGHRRPASDKSSRSKAALGKSYLGGGLIVGGAYYAQWKVTEDQLADFDLPGGSTISLNARNKHKVYGFGPDVTLPIASKSELFALVNFRYMWETGARMKTEGQTLVLTATFPIPSVRFK